MLKTKQIYLLRHGEIVDSGENRYIGQTDVPLSSKGLAQALRWRQELSHVVFEGIYCSDLVRALDTAKCVANMDESHIHILPQLREIDLGDWDGETMEYIKTRFPDSWEDRGRRMDSFKTPNGESFQDLYERVIPVFQKIISEMTGNVLMVGHAGVNRIILCHVLDKPIKKLFRIPQEYAALNIIEVEKGVPVVLTMNRTPPSKGRLLGV
jgi:alpha-ribazole phosphatase